MWTCKIVGISENEPENVLFVCIRSLLRTNQISVLSLLNKTVIISTESAGFSEKFTAILRTVNLQDDGIHQDIRCFVSSPLYAQLLRRGDREPEQSLSFTIYFNSIEDGESICDIQRVCVELGERVSESAVNLDKMHFQQRIHSLMPQLVTYVDRDDKKEALPTSIFSALLQNKLLYSGQYFSAPLFGLPDAPYPKCEFASRIEELERENNAQINFQGPALFKIRFNTALEGAILGKVTGATQFFAHSASGCLVCAGHRQTAELPTLQEWLDAASSAYSGHMNILKQLIYRSYAIFRQHQLSQTAHPDSPLSSPSGILLIGPPGVGKSHLVRVLAATSGRKLFRVSPVDVYSSLAGEAEEKLYRLAKEVRLHAPCFVLIEDADILLPKDPKSPIALRCRDILLESIRDSNESGVVWIAETSFPDAVASQLTLPNVLSDPVRLFPPTTSERRAILFHLTGGGMRLHADGENHSTTHAGRLEETEETEGESEVLTWVAKHTQGYLPADLHAVVSRVVEAVHRTGLPPASIRNMDATLAYWKQALETIPSTALAQATGAAPQEIPLDSLFGIQDEKKTVFRTVLGPLSHPELYYSLGGRPSKGVLFCGPSGSGKTTLAHAAAYEAVRSGIANALVISSPDLVSAVVGQTEKVLSDLFAQARSLSPCILVFDQIEILAPYRGHVAVADGDTRGNSVQNESISDDERSDSEVHDQDSDNSDSIYDGEDFATQKFDSEKKNPQSLVQYQDRLLSALLMEMDGISENTNVVPQPSFARRQMTNTDAAQTSLHQKLSYYLRSEGLEDSPQGSDTLPPASVHDLLLSLDQLDTEDSADPNRSTRTADLHDAQDVTASCSQPLVMVIGTTNDPNALDPAILRPGRLDSHIRLSLPDEGMRLRYLLYLLQNKPLVPCPHLDDSRFFQGPHESPIAGKDPTTNSRALEQWESTLSDVSPCAEHACWKQAVSQAIAATAQQPFSAVARVWQGAALRPIRRYCEAISRVGALMEALPDGQRVAPDDILASIKELRCSEI